MLPNEVLDESKNSLYFILPITFSSCQVGEIFDRREKRCVECPAGKYALLNGETECKNCPEHALCKGGNNIYIYPGFWRSSNYSSRIYACNFKELCIGGPGMFCKNNHGGKLCEECINNSTKSFITKKNYFGDCLPCELDKGTFAANILLIIITSLFLILLIALFVLRWLSENQRTKIKIIVNFIQNIYFIPFWTLIEKSTIEFSFFSNSLFNFSRDLFSMDCFFLHFGYDQLSIFDKILIEIVYFLIILILAFVCLSLYKIIVFKEKKTINFFLVIYTWHYFIFPYIIKDCLSTLNCIEIDGELLIVNELNIKCWNKEFIFYAGFLIFPLSFLFLVFIPVKITMKNIKKIFESIKKKRNIFKSFRKEDEKNIVFIGYRTSYHAFEKYKFIQKALIILFASFYEREKMRILYSLFIYSFHLVLTWRKSPFKNKKIKLFENIQLSITMFSYFALFYSYLAENKILNQIIFNTLISLFLIFFLISFCSFFGKKIQTLAKQIKNILLGEFLLMKKIKF